MKPKTTLHKFGWIILILAGMTLWAAVVLAEDALEIGKSYVVRRSSATYSPKEPEGYKDFKWGMTFDEIARLLGKWPTPSSETQGMHFKDSIGSVGVEVFLAFSEPVKPESKLDSVSLSFKPKDYETLKEIFIQRYGKPTSSQQEPYKTQGGAESTNETLMWKGPHSFINLSRYGSRITDGSAMMGTNESLEAFSKKTAEEIKDAAKGL